MSVPPGCVMSVERGKEAPEAPSLGMSVGKTPPAIPGAMLCFGASSARGFAPCYCQRGKQGAKKKPRLLPVP